MFQIDETTSYSVLVDLNKVITTALHAEQETDAKKHLVSLPDAFYEKAIHTLEEGLRIVSDTEKAYFDSSRRWNNERMGKNSHSKDPKKDLAAAAPMMEIPSAEEQKAAKEALCFHRAMEMKRASSRHYVERVLSNNHRNWLEAQSEVVTTPAVPSYVEQKTERAAVTVPIPQATPEWLLKMEASITPNPKTDTKEVKRHNDLRDRFHLLVEQVHRMTAARAPKDAWTADAKGAVVVPATNAPAAKSKSDFPFSAHGDLPWIIICEACSYCKFMYLTTGEDKWKIAYSAGVKQKKDYKSYSIRPITERLDACWAFCCSEFDDYCLEQAVKHPELKSVYGKYIEKFQNFTRADKQKEKDDISFLSGKKKGKKLRFDDYTVLRNDVLYGTALIGHTFDNPSYDWVTNEYYDIAVQAAAEAIMFTTPAQFPERFSYTSYVNENLETGTLDVYYPDTKPYRELNVFTGSTLKVLDLHLNEDEHRFVQRAIGRALYQERKGGDREVCLERLINYEDSKRLYKVDEGQEYAYRIDSTVDDLIYHSLDDLTDEEFEEEFELRKLEVFHPFDQGCVMAHFPSLDSRIINGTDCRIAWDQLINAKNPHTGWYVFSDREKLILNLRRKGYSCEEIGQLFPNCGDYEDYANVANEFTRIWVKPAAQAWLKELGYKGELEARCQLERYNDLRHLGHDDTARKEKALLIKREYAHDEKILTAIRKKRERKKELREKRIARNKLKRKSK